MPDEQTHESPWIIDTTAATFDRDVFEKSHETLVVLDFWAPWWAPCRQLSPVLESLANELDGKFMLVKANTEEVPEAAGKFQVTGIPAVYAVLDGEVVDGFQGALPEEQIRGWLDSLAAASTLAEANRLEELSPEGAEAKYRTVAEQLPNEPTPKIGLARVLLAQDRIAESQALIDELEKRGFLEPEAEKVKAALELRGMQSDDLSPLRAQVEADPENLPLQLELAQALAGAKEYESALQACLAIIEKDKKGVGDTARQVMIDIFRVLPDDSELTPTYRRKLSSALY